MESPGTADTKTSSASVSSTASLQQGAWTWKLQEEPWKDWWCAIPSSLQVLFRHFSPFTSSMEASLPSQDNKKDLEASLPSCSFSVVPTFFIFLGDFMKRGKMVLRPRISTNLWQLSVPSGPIMAWSSTFRALLREIFFSLWKQRGKLNFSGAQGALDHTTLKRQHEQGNEYDKGSMMSLSTSSKQDFLQEAKTLYRQILFSKLWLRIFSWLFLF